jgi:Flp pilus assembly protein TadD
MTIDQAFEQAVQQHRSGQLPEAEAIYRQILAVQPAHADALHLLGVLAQQTGNPAPAVELIRQAIALNPRASHFQNNLGNALRELGRRDEALAAYEAALRLDPQSADAQGNLGSVLRETGRLEEAIQAYQKSLALNPDDADTWSNLGDALREHGRFDSAVTACRRAQQLAPGRSEPSINLGAALHAQGKFEEAVNALQEAQRLAPGSAKVLYNLGASLRAAGRLEEAIAAYQAAIQLQPGSSEAYNNLGDILGEQQKFAEAIAAFRIALRLQPDNAEAQGNLGVALMLHGQLEPATVACRAALHLRPADPGCRLNLAFMLLLQGKYEEAWPLHEARWEAGDFTSPRRNFAQPMWDGRPLNGDRVLIHAEQGLGDSIQFIRFASLIAARGGQVIAEVQPPLVSLFRTVPGVGEVLPAGNPLPAFAFHVPMLSLPMACGTTLETIPHEVPYLTVDETRRSAWREKLAVHRAPLRVGFAWTGSAANAGNPMRSIPPELFKPLLDVPGVDFFCLQKDQAAESPLPELLDYTADLTSFAETAALLEQLDLVVSVDTSVLHLAGALGRPAWALLRFAPDWRWMRDREDSPWYPTLRLFRQEKTGEWQKVIRAVARELAATALAATRATGR